VLDQETFAWRKVVEGLDLGLEVGYLYQFLLAAHYLLRCEKFYTLHLIYKNYGGLKKETLIIEG
jgi:hypothetical protein